MLTWLSLAETWPLLGYRRETDRVRPWGFAKVLEERASYAAWVLEEVRRRGPPRAAAPGSAGARRRHGERPGRLFPDARGRGQATLARAGEMVRRAEDRRCSRRAIGRAARLGGLAGLSAPIRSGVRRPLRAGYAAPLLSMGITVGWACGSSARSTWSSSESCRGLESTKRPSPSKSADNSAS